MPIALPFAGCWEIRKGQKHIDSTTFFDSLFELIETDASIFFEGTSIEREPRQLMASNLEEGPYLPATQCIWVLGGKIEQYRCKFTQDLLRSFSEMSNRYAEPELFDSLFIYLGNDPLMEWPDAFDGPLWIALSIPETRIKTFSERLRSTYAKTKDA